MQCNRFWQDPIPAPAWHRELRNASAQCWWLACAKQEPLLWTGVASWVPILGNRATKLLVLVLVRVFASGPGCGPVWVHCGRMYFVVFYSQGGFLRSLDPHCACAVFPRISCQFLPCLMSSTFQANVARQTLHLHSHFSWIFTASSVETEDTDRSLCIYLFFYKMLLRHSKMV